MTARPADAHARLAQALQRAPFTDAEREDLRERLNRGRNSGRILGALLHGRPVSVDDFLAAHAVKGWDPLTSRKADPAMPALGGPLHRRFFALKLRASRMLPNGSDLSVRRAAALAGADSTSWFRAEGGETPVGVVNFLRLCAAMDCHPHEVCEQARPCFTANMRCSTLKSNALSPADQPAA